MHPTAPEAAFETGEDRSATEGEMDVPHIDEAGIGLGIGIDRIRGGVGEAGQNRSSERTRLRSRPDRRTERREAEVG